MINTITINFWSLNENTAKSLYRDIKELIKNKENPFLITDVDTKLDYNK